MTETRYDDTGSLSNADSHNAVRANVRNESVLWGLDLSVASDATTIDVSAGAVTTAEGVVIHNDSTRDIDFQASSEAKLYTITMDHEQTSRSGGVASELSITEINDSGGDPVFKGAVDGSVVLGWLDYPGGSVDPTDDMLHAVPKTREEAYQTQVIVIFGIAPFVIAPGYLIDVDEEIVVSHSLDGSTSKISTLFDNTAGVSSTSATIVLSAENGSSWGPKILEITGAVGAGASLKIETVLNGVATEIADITVATILTDAAYDINTDGSMKSVEPNSGYVVRLTLTLPVGATITLESLAVTADPYPEPFEQD